MLTRIIKRREGDKHAVAWQGPDLDDQVLESYSLIDTSCQRSYLASSEIQSWSKLQPHAELYVHSN